MNPFKFGVVVTGEDFCDRKGEIEELLRDIRSGVHVTLVSPRRYGKTSLIMNLFERVDFARTFYVDLMGVTSVETFLGAYTKTFLEGRGKRRKIETALRKFLPKVDGIQIALGSVGFSLSIAPTEKNIEEVLDISEKFDQPVIVAFDEFQEILNLKEVDLLAILRKKAQFFRNTTLIFSGSKSHVMRDIFLNQEKPFYRFSKVVNLGLLDKGETTQFIMSKFNASGVVISNKLCDDIYEVCCGHPYYVQYLSHILWNIVSLKAKKVCSQSDLQRAIEQVLLTERAMFEFLWDSLTANQRIVLKNLAMGKSPYRTNMSSGSVRRALEALENLDVIERCDRGYKLVDPFLRIWLTKTGIRR
ncbi:hypothetical protein A4H02_05445 [Fervidobacterium thailandense]|uniref:ATPase domain-containing protein n=1 Tax=Fervidobacterium thailandense TaxID=1008305 RepID=A0A1E3G3T5_9BACT|nr:hypothetical protein A4H02_05445 [Fervidobacterium thailandense]